MAVRVCAHQLARFVDKIRLYGIAAKARFLIKQFCRGILMMRSFTSRAAALATILVAFNSVTASAQTVTAVEYYNKAVDAYFLTARANEQATLDTVADFQRTGMTFQAVAAASASAAQTKICRFYISLPSPFTSSHFYGRQGTDCELLLAQNLAGFTYEDYDFATQQPTGGICPAGTLGIYRGFRAAANGKTSNHRYSASLASYNTAVTAGYVGENIVFCAASATAANAVVTPPVAGSGECGAFYLSKKSITSQTTVSAFGFSSTSTSTVAFDYDLTPVSFNGRSAARQFATTTAMSGSSSVSTLGLTFFQDNANDYTLLGSRDTAKSPVQDTYFDPPWVYPKKWTTGQKVDYSHAIVFNPSQTIGSGTQVGSATFLGMETVTVPAGTFNACKYKVDQVTRYPSAGSTSSTTFTSWNVPNVGSVKSEGTDISTVPGAGTVTSDYLIVATVVR
jgi:hypothetical protein